MSEPSHILPFCVNSVKSYIVLCLDFRVICNINQENPHTPPSKHQLKSQLLNREFSLILMCDIFACCPFQFEMLTGALPFQGKNRKETMTLILK